MKRRVDRRVQRTRRLLREALFSLIQEKGFEALSVQEIIDRANVGRATFYAHFDSKVDLLLAGFDDLRASLKERQREALVRGRSLDERMLAFSREILAHVKEHRDLFGAMTGKESGAVIQQVLRTMLLDLVREDVRAISPAGEASPVPAEALVQFIAGGFFGLLIWWLEGKPRSSANEIDALFRRLVFPAVKAGLRPV
ncbi:MAG: TetR/AcrR family transcriptional regulator [Acidobacteriota bacterium]